MPAASVSVEPQSSGAINALFDDAHYGIMVLISGTLVSSGVALLVAIPMGTVIAIYLSEFANPKVREIAKRAQTQGWVAHGAPRLTPLLKPSMQRRTVRTLKSSKRRVSRFCCYLIV